MIGAKRDGAVVEGGSSVRVFAREESRMSKFLSLVSLLAAHPCVMQAG